MFAICLYLETDECPFLIPIFLVVLEGVIEMEGVHWSQN